MFVYLAGSIRKDAEENKLYRARATKYLQDLGIDIFDPSAAWGWRTQKRSSAHSVALVDLLAVKQSAAVLAHYSSSSFGTNAEVGYALAWDKPVVMWGEGLMEATSAMLRHKSIHSHDGLEEALSCVVGLLLGPRPGRPTELRE